MAASTDTRPAGSGGLIARIPTDDTLPRWRAYASAHPVATAPASSELPTGWVLA